MPKPTRNQAHAQFKNDKKEAKVDYLQKYVSEQPIPQNYLSGYSTQIPIKQKQVSVNSYTN